jgi:2-methylcitrate dehydratase PrpD
MLVHGRVGLATYTPDALADERVLALTRKVRYETKEYASYPAAFPGGVRIALRDGRTLEADFPHQLGAPENPMSAEQVQAKFRENAALAGGSFDQIEAAVLELERRDDLHAVLSLLGREAVAA